MGARVRRPGHRPLRFCAHRHSLSCRRSDANNYGRNGAELRRAAQVVARRHARQVWFRRSRAGRVAASTADAHVRPIRQSHLCPSARTAGAAVANITHVHGRLLSRDLCESARASRDERFRAGREHHPCRSSGRRSAVSGRCRAVHCGAAETCDAVLGRRSRPRDGFERTRMLPVC